MRINIIAAAACAAAYVTVCGAAVADQYDGLTPQQREWQNTARFYDDWQRDIRNRGGSGGSSGGRNYAAEVANSQQEARRLYDQSLRERASAAEFRARLERLAAEQRRAQEQLNAQQRAEYEKLYESRYRQFLAMGGHGTQATPPHFASDEERSQWYLKQAEAGDPYGAAFLARQYFGQGKLDLAAQWLAKADLSHPITAAQYGYLLANGAGGVPRDTARGRAMMEKAALEDTTGHSAHLLSSALFQGVGFPKDPAQGGYFLGLSVVQADNPGLAETLLPLVQWQDTMPQREARRRAWRTELKQWAVSSPQDYVAAMEHALSLKDYAVYGNMGGAIAELEPPNARKVYQEWLNIVVSRPSAWDALGRKSIIEGLGRNGDPDTSAQYLLPDAFHPTGMAFSPMGPEEGEKYWKSGGAAIEKWAAGADDLAPRARRALVAREMGRWPKVSPRQSPRAVLDKIRSLGIANPLDVLSGEILDGVNEARPEWADKDKATPWLEELVALDGSLAELRTVYANAPALRAAAALAGDPVLAPLRAALDAPQNFTAAQLDAAEVERNAASLLLHSSPRTAYNSLLKAFEDGDALAGWQLLLMSDQQYLKIDLLRQPILDLTDDRLQRDARGEGDRAATAALALHFLHNPNAPGREWLRGWRPTRASTTNWLKLAEEKGHPWAVFHSAGGYSAAEKARNRYNAEAQSIWPWLAAHAGTLRKQDLWRRDSRLLELFAPDTDIRGLQPALNALESVAVETVVFSDMMPRLAAARALVTAYEKEPGAQNPERAALLKKEANRLQNEDAEAGVLLPRNRSQRLGLLVEAAIYGDADAPLEVAALLKAPGFPLKPDPEEAGAWLSLGATRLEKWALTAKPDEAMHAAFSLAQEYDTGQTLPQNLPKAVHFYGVAATLGHQRAASKMAAAYRWGELALPKDEAQWKRWEGVAEDIVMGRYKVPASALAGRGQTAAPAPKPAAKASPGKSTPAPKPPAKIKPKPAAKSGR